MTERQIIKKLLEIIEQREHIKSSGREVKAMMFKQVYKLAY